MSECEDTERAYESESKIVSKTEKERGQRQRERERDREANRLSYKVSQRDRKSM